MKPERTGRVRCSAWLGVIASTLFRFLRLLLIDLRFKPRILFLQIKYLVKRRLRFIFLRLQLFANGIEEHELHTHGRTLHDQFFKPVYRVGQFHGDIWHPMPPNDPSSATRPAGRHDCNSDAMAGFAAAHG